MTTVPVFDGHNDFLLRLLNNPAERETIFLQGDGKGHLDLPRMRKGCFVGGFFAIYIPSPAVPGMPDYDAIMEHVPYQVPLPALMQAADAMPVAMAMAGHLRFMERAAPDDFKVCTSAEEIRASIQKNIVAAVMHMEGAEAIGADLDALHLFHQLGLRSLGPVWSRPTIFGHGVPFQFPGGPDTGPGLTEAGKDLVRLCDRLSIMIDLSHMNEKGFDDVARLSSKPLVATHSNAHAITPSSRNLTDRQLDAIRESKGMVGLNFATLFLRPDGRKSPEMTLEPALRHLDHLISRLGEDHVGFGSDFDGATIPDPIRDVAGVPTLIDAMRTHGYGETLIRKIASENWIALLERTWGR